MEGKQLKGVCNELLRNLDTEALYRGWIKQVEEELKSGGGGGGGGEVLVVGRDRGGAPCLKVNFEESTVLLFKEVGGWVGGWVGEWTFSFIWMGG